MFFIFIESAMVNPKGKSKALNNAIRADLANKEWVQLRNPTPNPVLLEGLSLKHWIFSKDKSHPEEKLIIQLNGTLEAGAALRIHSGAGRSWHDTKRGIIHTYVSPKTMMYLFQIMHPDCFILYHQGRLIDNAKYEIPVPEGRRLRRTHHLAEHMLKQVELKKKK